MLGSLAWALWEIGFDWWALAPRGGLSVVIGLFMLIPRWRANPAMERGAEIAEHGSRSADVPACSGGHDAPDKKPIYPDLDIHPAPYLEAQLRLFREGTRGGSAFHHLMENAAKGLSDADIRAVAAYYGSRRGEAER